MVPYLVHLYQQLGLLRSGLEPTCPVMICRECLAYEVLQFYSIHRPALYHVSTASSIGADQGSIASAHMSEGQRRGSQGKPGKHEKIDDDLLQAQELNVMLRAAFAPSSKPHKS